MESLFDAVLDNEGTEGTKGERKRIYSHGLQGNNSPRLFPSLQPPLPSKASREWQPPKAAMQILQRHRM
jgi:hypothetical protein